MSQDLQTKKHNLFYTWQSINIPAPYWPSSLTVFAETYGIRGFIALFWSANALGRVVSSAVAQESLCLNLGLFWKTITKWFIKLDVENTFLAQKEVCKKHNWRYSATPTLNHCSIECKVGFQIRFIDFQKP